MAQGMCSILPKEVYFTKSLNLTASAVNPFIGKLHQQANLISKKCAKPVKPVKSPSSVIARLLKKKAVVAQINKIKQSSVLKSKINPTNMISSILDMILGQVTGQSAVGERLTKETESNIENLENTHQAAPGCTMDVPEIQTMEKLMSSSNAEASVEKEEKISITENNLECAPQEHKHMEQTEIRTEKPMPESKIADVLDAIVEKKMFEEEIECEMEIYAEIINQEDNAMKQTELQTIDMLESNGAEVSNSMVEIEEIVEENENNLGNSNKEEIAMEINETQSTDAILEKEMLKKETEITESVNKDLLLSEDPTNNMQHLIIHQELPDVEQSGNDSFNCHVETKSFETFDELCTVEDKYWIVNSILDEVIAQATIEEVASQPDLKDEVALLVNEVVEDKTENIIHLEDNYISINNATAENVSNNNPAISDVMEYDYLEETLTVNEEKLSPCLDEINFIHTESNSDHAQLIDKNNPQDQFSFCSEDNSQDKKGSNETDVENQQQLANISDNDNGNNENDFTNENQFDVNKTSEVEIASRSFSPELLNGKWLRIAPALKRLRPSKNVENQAMFSSPSSKKMRSKFFFKKLSLADCTFLFKDKSNKNETTVEKKMSKEDTNSKIESHLESLLQDDKPEVQTVDKFMPESFREDVSDAIVEKEISKSNTENTLLTIPSTDKHVEQTSIQTMNNFMPKSNSTDESDVFVEQEMLRKQTDILESGKIVPDSISTITESVKRDLLHQSKDLTNNMQQLIIYKELPEEDSFNCDVEMENIEQIDELCTSENKYLIANNILDELIARATTEEVAPQPDVKHEQATQVINNDSADFDVTEKDFLEETLEVNLGKLSPCLDEINCIQMTSIQLDSNLDGAQLTDNHITQEPFSFSSEDNEQGNEGSNEIDDGNDCFNIGQRSEIPIHRVENDFAIKKHSEAEIGPNALSPKQIRQKLHEVWLRSSPSQTRLRPRSKQIKNKSMFSSPPSKKMRSEYLVEKLCSADDSFLFKDNVDKLELIINRISQIPNETSICEDLLEASIQEVETDDHVNDSILYKSITIESPPAEQDDQTVSAVSVCTSMLEAILDEIITDEIAPLEYEQTSGDFDLNLEKLIIVESSPAEQKEQDELASTKAVSVCSSMLEAILDELISDEICTAEHDQTSGESDSNLEQMIIVESTPAEQEEQKVLASTKAVSVCTNILRAIIDDLIPNEIAPVEHDQTSGVSDSNLEQMIIVESISAEQKEQDVSASTQAVSVCTSMLEDILDEIITDEIAPPEHDQLYGESDSNLEQMIIVDLTPAEQEEQDVSASTKAVNVCTSILEAILDEIITDEIVPAEHEQTSGESDSNLEQMIIVASTPADQEVVSFSTNSVNICTSILGAIINELIPDEVAQAKPEEQSHDKEDPTNECQVQSTNTIDAEDLCKAILHAIIERTVATKTEMSACQQELEDETISLTRQPQNVDQPSQLPERIVIASNIIDILIDSTIKIANHEIDVEVCQQATEVESEETSYEADNVTADESSTFATTIYDYLLGEVNKIVLEKEETSSAIASSIIDILIKATVAKCTKESSPRTLKRKIEDTIQVSSTKKRCLQLKSSPASSPNAKKLIKSKINVKRLAPSTPLRLTRSQLKQDCKTQKSDETSASKHAGSRSQPWSPKDALKSVAILSLEKLNESVISKYYPEGQNSSSKIPDPTKSNKKSQIISQKKLEPEQRIDSLKRKLKISDDEAVSSPKRAKVAPRSPRLTTTRSIRKVETPIKIFLEPKTPEDDFLISRKRSKSEIKEQVSARSIRKVESPSRIVSEPKTIEDNFLISRKRSKSAIKRQVSARFIRKVESPFKIFFETKNSEDDFIISCKRSKSEIKEQVPARFIRKVESPNNILSEPKTSEDDLLILHKRSKSEIKEQVSACKNVVTPASKQGSRPMQSARVILTPLKIDTRRTSVYILNKTQDTNERQKLTYEITSVGIKTRNKPSASPTPLAIEIRKKQAELSYDKITAKNVKPPAKKVEKELFNKELALFIKKLSTEKTVPTRSNMLAETSKLPRPSSTLVKPSKSKPLPVNTPAQAVRSTRRVSMIEVPATKQQMSIRSQIQVSKQTDKKKNPSSVLTTADKRKSTLTNAILSTPVRKQHPRLADEDYSQSGNCTSKIPTTVISDEEEITILCEKLSPTRNLSNKPLEEITILDSDSEDDEPLVSLKKRNSKNCKQAFQMLKRQQQLVVNKNIKAQQIVNKNIKAQQVVNKNIKAQQVVNKNMKAQEVVNVNKKALQVVNVNKKAEQVVNKKKKVAAKTLSKSEREAKLLLEESLRFTGQILPRKRRQSQIPESFTLLTSMKR